MAGLKRLQGRESKKEYTVRHDDLGWMLWERSLQAHVIDQLKKFSSISERGEVHVKALLEIFARIALGHHGKPPSERVSNFDVVFLEPDVVSWAWMGERHDVRTIGFPCADGLSQIGFHVRQVPFLRVLTDQKR